ncbi:4-carboxy-4-hydroxy-2-oxoadipate aldolase/oxaloacetate decarboxylase [Fodinicurvata sp. EGI_FJ10296]|uniref:4-carboxy-4-hydroxy-2-oxoadipate aldolase/oxaloacetate decarboxylase n=1 Tax=Fodinicurvata sp. EGI_FJ10296 TaxID=3231908 RepID=UPI003456EB63
MDIIRTIERPSPELIRQFADFDPATVYEAQGQSGMVDPAIKPVWQGATVLGPALTVRGPPGDNLMLHKAVEVAQPGDIIVADLGGYQGKGAWGEVLAAAAQARGVAGLVVDHAIRDVSALRTLGFPGFARGLSIGACSKRNPGLINHPIIIGGQPVNPGDIVVGDDDGVAIVPREHAGTVLEAARARAKKEDEIMAALKSGRTTLDLLGLHAVISATGMTEEQ